MTIIWIMLALLRTTPEDVRRLETAGLDCTWRGSAREHLVAARAIAIETGVSAEIMLSIAHHESCMDNQVRTGLACGVMQTIGSCPSSMIEGYRAGAMELREWLRVSGGNLRVALAGYSGGFKVMRACAREGACSYADVFMRGAARLR